MKNNNTTYTLVTGASSGIGRALAEESARQGHNLILISLPEEKLKEFSVYLESRYKIDAKYLEIDLTEKNAAQTVYSWCQNSGSSVDRLINNAGIISTTTPFECNTLSLYEKMIRLNVTAVTLLTQNFLPELKKHSEAHILNVCSTGAFQPVPYKAVYGATKAFVFSLSMALREELRGSRVKVSVLCPGSVPTNNEIKGRIAKAGFLWKISILSAERVAKIALKGMELRRQVIVPGAVNNLGFLLGRLMPLSVQMRIVSRLFKKYFPSNVGIPKTTLIPCKGDTW